MVQCGSESLVGARSRNHGCRGLDNIPSPPVPCLNRGGGDRWCRRLYRVEVQPVPGFGNLHSFPSGRTQQQK
ncbi:hypothetical protein TNCV_2198811 [Trichonephila clavipes]|nr:hypothetical protein TNCV_2198811 [Trichonephila clavipes]